MSPTTKSIQPILDHAKKHLSLSEKEISIDEIPIPNLPSHMDVYYVEKEGSYGNIYFHYVVSNGELFCSADEDAFERLLKKEDFLSKRNLNADQLVTLFRLLKVKMRDTEVIAKSDLAQGGVHAQYAQKVSAPEMQQSGDGVQIVFWITALRRPEPEKWTVSITRDYRVEYEKEPLK